MAADNPPTQESPNLQNLALLKVYTVIRVFLCAALLTTFVLGAENPLVGALKPEQFLIVTCIYLLLNVVGLIVYLPKHILINDQRLFANFLIDIFAIILVADASNGIVSGLAILLVIIIAAASIMLARQLALLTAAIATIAILADTARLIIDGYLPLSSLLPTGLLGVTLFITAIFIEYLAARIRIAQQLAEQRGFDVSQLQSLNQSIVQRMRTGIIVVNDVGEIQLANAAAGELLGNTDLLKLAENTRPATAEPITLQPELLAQFQLWRRSPNYHTPPFQVNEAGPELHVSFSAPSNDPSTGTDTDIQSGENRETLIFIENNRRLAQQAQQMKLASLGRLTASIAHEIRNPLGAISHASQLLAESNEIPDADKRLCEIIQNHSNRMNKVIENVLQLSRRHAPDPERINLAEWLQQFINDFCDVDDEQTNHENHHIDLTGSCDSPVTIDCSQFSQVLSNLIQNGLRYSKQQTGVAAIELRLHSHPNTKLPQLDIIDNGAGIDEKAQEKLFEPFYTTEAKGSGLGLYISRELCEANEARLEYLINQQGKSCFRISFPHPDRRLAPE